MKQPGPIRVRAASKELIERCAEDFGCRTAIVHGAEALTYRNLNRLANGMAGDLSGVLREYWHAA